MPEHPDRQHARELVPPTTGSPSPGGGINTFLIADIRGYTRYTLEHGDEAAAALTARFAAIAREEVEAADGRLLELRGDEVLAVFASARHALQGGVDLQYRVARESTVNPGLAFEVGVGLDAGEAVQTDGGYRGAALNLAARLCSVAGAGEVLASEGVIHLAQKVPGLVYVPRGEMELKGFADRVRVIQILRDPDLSQPDLIAVATAAESAPSFGTLLRRYRRHAGLTQEELAEAANLSVRAVSDLERGERKRPHRDTIELLADALRLSIEQRATLEASVSRRRGSQRDPSSDAMTASGAHDPAMDTPLPLGGFLGALPEGVLVGRGRELDRLQSMLDTVASGTGQMIVLAGEPGVGKTRLAQEVMLGARNRKFVIATGRCYEPEEEIPFYPFIEALAALYAAAPPAVRADIPRRWPQLELLLPERFAAPPTPFSASDEEQRLFWSVTGFVRAIVEAAPIALLLDDLHWADPSSIKLLLHVVRHTRADRVLVLGTYRNVEIDRGHHLERALLDLHREQLVTNFSIARLSPEETGLLAAAILGADHVDPELVGVVHRRTEGNPFFVREILRELVDRGDIYSRGGTWVHRMDTDLPVPPNIRAVIGQRLARLAPSTQEVIQAASVLGQTFSFGDLLELPLSPSEDEIDAALEEAAASGLLRETGRERYAFNHALTQQALYAGLSAHRRSKLHLAAAQQIERSSTRHTLRGAELAWHFREGGDDMAALPWLVVAGDQAESVFAHEEAERQYRAALDIARRVYPSTDQSSRTQAEILEKLGTELKIVARFDAALDALEGSVTLYRSVGDLEAEARVTGIIGLIYHLKGMPREGISRVQQLLRTLETHGGLEMLGGVAASLYMALAYLFSTEGKYDESSRASRRAEELARVAGDERVLAEAAVSQGAMSLLSAQGDDPASALEEGIRLAETAGDTDALFAAIDTAAEAYLVSGDLERCKVQRLRALELVERLGDPAKIGFELTGLGQLSLYLGDWPAARTYLDRAVEILQPLGPTWVLAYAMIRSAQCSAATGGWEGACRTLDEAISIAEQSRNPSILAVAQEVFAEIDLLQARPASAVRRLVHLLDTGGIAESEIVPVLPVLARAYLEVGDVDRAASVIDEVLERAARQQRRLVLIDAVRVHGLVLAAQDRLVEARDELEKGLTMALALKLPYAEARLQRELGGIFNRLSEPEESRARLQRALAIFQRLGAQMDAEHVEATLNQLERA